MDRSSMGYNFTTDLGPKMFAYKAFRPRLLYTSFDMALFITVSSRRLYLDSISGCLLCRVTVKNLCQYLDDIEIFNLVLHLGLFSGG
jgi:hypothetical protein